MSLSLGSTSTFSLNDQALRANCHIIPINSSGDLSCKSSLSSVSWSLAFFITISLIQRLLNIVQRSAFTRYEEDAQRLTSTANRTQHTTSLQEWVLDH